MAPDFKHQLQSLIPTLLHPDNLAEKEINGNKVTCMGLLEFFKVLPCKIWFIYRYPFSFALSFHCLILVSAGVYQDLPGGGPATTKDYADGAVFEQTSVSVSFLSHYYV